MGLRTYIQKFLVSAKDDVPPPAPTVRDAWGNEHGRPGTDSLAVRSIPDSLRDRASLGSILSDITPSRLLGIFQEADNGMVGRQIELARDLVERDGHLRSCTAQAKLAVTSMDWAVAPGADDDASQQAAEDARGWWEAIGSDALMGRLLDAILQQYTIEQVIWDTGSQQPGGESRRWTPRACDGIDARRLCWPQTAVASVVTPSLMGENWTPTETMPIQPGRHICHLVDVERGRPGKGALIRCIAVLWMFKHYAILDWVGLVEQFGRPWTIVQYAPGMSDKELSELLLKLKVAMANRIIAVPQGSSVENTQGTAHTTTPPQKEFIVFVNETISKVLLGNTTQTDAAANNDNVSSPTHANVTRMLRDARAKSLAETLNRDLFTPWFTWNADAYPGGVAPKIGPVLADKPEPKARGEVFEIAGRLGLKAKSEQVYRELGIEKPDDVPEVIELRGQQPGGDLLSQLMRGGSPGNGETGRGGEGARERETDSPGGGEIEDEG